MFQWKTKFPSRPSPPTPEQQKEDLEKLREMDFPSHSSLSNGENLTKTDVQIQKYRQLTSNCSVIEKTVQDLEVSLTNLKEASEELIQLSQDVREKASTTIS